MADKVILFLGTHRTGTTLLADFFSHSYPKVYSVHQPKYSRLINVLSTMTIEKRLPESIVKKVTQYTRIEPVRRIPQKYYIETNGFNYLSARYITEAFPGSRIIHVVRDPRYFVQSYLNFIYGRWQSWVANKCVPFWNVSASRTKQLPDATWDSYDEFQRYCWYWRYKNTLISNLYGNRPDYMLIRFEDLLGKKDRNELMKLLDFVELPYSEGLELFFHKKLNESSDKSPHLLKWQQWPEQKCRQLHEICGDLMKTYGYGLEQEWVARVGASVR